MLKPEKCQKEKKLKPKQVLLLSLSILLTLVTVNAFSQQQESMKIKAVKKIVAVETAPKMLHITIERSRLESPEGMKIFKTQTLQINQQLLDQFIVKKRLLKIPLTFRNSNSVTEKLFIENETKVPRLIVNETRGHLTLLPNVEQLAKIKSALLPEQEALVKATQEVQTLKLLPADDSRFAAKKIVTLSQATLKPGRNTPEKQDIFQTVLFQRTVDSKPIVGAGSQLSVDLGDKGGLEGFNRRCNKIIPANIKPEFLSEKEIYDEIEKLLNKEFHGDLTITVQPPRLVYSGDDREYVQPAYTFTAVIKNPEAVGNSYYSGLVSALRNPPEPVRRVRQADESPAMVKGSPRMSMQNATGLSAANDPTIGRYVVRNDSGDWVDDANDFKRGLQNGHNSSLPAITFTDYYWDEPRLWTSDENSFVDRWNVVLMEGHGNHWLFTTRSNCCDVVNLNASSQPGYGDHAGSAMRFLILKGCSIIPAPPDAGNWPDPWWRIFKGLRQAVGFRTTMYINDNISDDFGYWIGKNCRVLDSWFYSTNTNSSYNWNRFWGAEVTGYGAVVMIPGHEGDGIYHTTPASVATSAGLRIYWQH